MLSTKEPHPHKITPECPLPCLRGFVRPGALTAVGYEIRDDAHPYGTLAKLAEWHQENKLDEIRNIGPAAIDQIGTVLKEAGLIPDSQNTPSG